MGTEGKIQTWQEELEKKVKTEEEAIGNSQREKRVEIIDKKIIRLTKMK